MYIKIYKKLIEQENEEIDNIKLNWHKKNVRKS